MTDWREPVLVGFYLAASLCFILALKWLSHPGTARRGVRVGEFGMAGAIVATLLHADIVDVRWIVVAAILGAAIGAVIAVFVPMTAVPQRIAFSHACGALAAALVGTGEYLLNRSSISTFTMAVLGAEMLLGYLTFTGSMVAFGKLQGVVRDRPYVFPGQNLVNGAALALGLVLVGVITAGPSRVWLLPALIVVSLAVGVMLVVRIGGADMPVVISLLNSFAGLSGAALGFAIGNPILIVAGALDGSAGFVLSVFMCRAMNRSLVNVLFGAVGTDDTATGGEHRPVRSTTAEEVAMFLDAANLVIIVPGYGMAAAQAQHKIRELADLLERRGTEVKFAIHPVAGRMPGHMNVLLAEANVPYDHLVELEDINPELARCDVAIVIGANDVVNPAARHDTASPIYGMPIMNVDEARAVVVIKRSMRAGFSGIENELFYLPQTMMLFGDAKTAAGELVHEVSRLPGGVSA